MQVEGQDARSLQCTDPVPGGLTSRHCTTQVMWISVRQQRQQCCTFHKLLNALQVSRSLFAAKNWNHREETELEQT